MEMGFILWVMFCIAFTLTTDDKAPWKFIDYITLIFSWALVPIAMGTWLGAKFMKDVKEIQK